MRFSRPVLGLAVFAVLGLTFLPSCGSSYSAPTSPSTPAPTPAPGPAADVTIQIVGMAGAQSFSPDAASVKVGQTVSWQNADTITHSIVQDGGGFSTSDIAPGATSAPLAMSAAGTLGYHCAIHPTMTGSLSVQ